jgi:hypothetical protein
MFPQFDQKLFEQLSTNPVSFLNTLHEFQLANFAAARQIADNNIHAFQELAKASDPQSFSKVQPAVLKSAIEQNVEVLTKLWQSFGVNLTK